MPREEKKANIYLYYKQKSLHKIELLKLNLCKSYSDWPSCHLNAWFNFGSLGPSRAASKVFQDNIRSGTDWPTDWPVLGLSGTSSTGPIWRIM